MQPDELGLYHDRAHGEIGIGRAAKTLRNSTAWDRYLISLHTDTGIFKKPKSVPPPITDDDRILDRCRSIRMEPLTEEDNQRIRDNYQFLDGVVTVNDMVRAFERAQYIMVADNSINTKPND